MSQKEQMKDALHLECNIYSCQTVANEQCLPDLTHEQIFKMYGDTLYFAIVRLRVAFKILLRTIEKEMFK